MGVGRQRVKARNEPFKGKGEHKGKGTDPDRYGSKRQARPFYNAEGR